MTITRGLFSSDSAEWETPWDLFAALDREFHFTLDVCATEANTKCRSYWSPEDDGLIQDWRGCCWCNPPYGRKIGRWIRKARDVARDGSIVVCLVPARTDTSWWHDLILPYAEVRFLRGRLYFGPAEEKRAPFPSAIAIFRPKEGSQS